MQDPFKKAEPPVGEIRRIRGHTDGVWSVDLSPNGTKLITGSGDKDRTARVWDFATGRELHETGRPRRVVRGHLPPDGRTCTGSQRGQADFTSGTPRRQSPRPVPGHSGPIYVLALTRNGKVAASGSEDGTARLWDTTTGLEVLRIKVAGSAVKAVAISNDGGMLLTGDYDELGKLWDTTTGLEVVRYQGHEKAWRSVAFTPDGRRFVSGSDDRSVRLWETATGRELGDFDGVTGTAHAVAVSPDGRRVAAGLISQRIPIWELSTGKLLETFDTKDAGGVLSLTFTADGRQIVAGCGDGVWVGGLPARYPGEAPAPARPAPKSARKTRGPG